MKIKWIKNEDETAYINKSEIVAIWKEKQQFSPYGESVFIETSSGRNFVISNETFEDIEKEINEN